MAPDGSILGLAAPVEATAYYALHDQVIVGAGCADADAEIEFPVGRQVQVNRREELLVLVSEGIEIADRAQRAVVFEATRNFLGEVETYLGVRRETPTLILAGAVERLVQRWIEGPVPATYFLVDDGTNLPGPGVGGKVSLLVADFCGKTQAHRPMPGFRDGDARTDVIAHPHPPAVGLDGGENVEPGLEPVAETVGDLERFVDGMVGRQDPIDYRLRSLHREVAMQFHHGVAGRDEIRAVDLNFSVVLR